MKISFTKEEARQFFSLQKEEYDIVRVVDPMAQQVYESIDEKADDAICCELWGRCERCENCTSLRALRTKGRAFKMEILNRRTFWVFSRYLEIDGQPRVAELVNDVTDNLIMNSNQLDTVGTLIENFNYQIISDALTGIYNRRFLDEHFLPSLQCCHERNLVVNLAIMDLDDFKRVNDNYGHQAGDMLLRDVAGFWKLHFDSREKDRERLTIRYGGDEFLIVTCGTDGEAFREEVLHYYAQMRKICYCGEDQIPFGISFGFSTSGELGADWSWDDLFARADRRLYAAKGRPFPEEG